MNKKIAAACMCLCLGLTIAPISHASMTKGSAAAESRRAAVSAEKDTAKKKTKTSKKTTEQKNEKQQKSDKKNADKKPAVKKTPVKKVKKLGKVYKLAKNYKQVYKVLKKSREDVYVAVDYAMAEDAAVVPNTAMAPTAAEDGAASSGASDVGTANSANREMVSKEVSGTEAADDSYSTTNLQVEGVDESDIVKTDGKYLYVAKEQQVIILNLQNGVPEPAATIEPEDLPDEGWIKDLYVAGGKLVLVMEVYETELQESESQPQDGGDADVDIQTSQAMKNLVIARPYISYINTQTKTKALSYDISDPKHPVYLDVTEQDGSYETSRKIGDRLYLFTTDYLSLNGRFGREETEDDFWLPAVDGKKIAANCIYIPKRGNACLVMSCVQLADSHKVLDSKLLINNSSEFYITGNSIYIYNTVYNYSSGGYSERTQIARFALSEDGAIQAVAAKAVAGSIQDTFAINEQGGYLRVLTSLTSKNPWENRVYVLDENLQVTGKVTGLAEGEQIYSARFFGNTGYFVTYRNTDPLFSVDFTDPKKPKIIGELKITGFSDYLHFWGENQLLGIGYETDEKTGAQQGIKLTMFDISNPAKVKAEASMVIKDADSTPATDNYKTVLIDRKKNVIAFTTEYYGDYYKDDYKINYRVFSYADGKFTSCLNHKLSEDSYMYEQRSLYANNVLYLAGKEKTIAFDMKKEYKKMGELEY